MRLRSMKNRWFSFKYNFAWERYIDLIDGWLPRCAIAIPVIGYLILFNDSIVSYLSFKKITANSVEFLFVNSNSRLRFLYFGLFFLGVSNLIYRLRRPWVHKIGKDSDSFVRAALETCTPSEYINYHSVIKHEGHYTLFGKYYDSEWDGFKQLAIGIEGRTDRENEPGHWNEAKSRYEYLLRSILRETYFRNSIKHRFSLSSCIMISFFGYVLLLIPSLDLFQAVVRSTMIF